jgi:uncharacterized membrane protein (DUF2068 family)
LAKDSAGRRTPSLEAEPAVDDPPFHCIKRSAAFEDFPSFLLIGLCVDGAGMKSSNDRLLRMIAVFKFLKAAMLIALGIGAFRLLHRDIGSLLEHWTEVLGVDPDNRFVDAVLSKLSDLRPEQIGKLGLGSFLYAGLFLAEGTGLWLQKRWGEWLTVIITGSLVPVELYEIYRHPSAVKVAVLVVNLGILGYLIQHIRTKRAG